MDVVYEYIDGLIKEDNSVLEIVEFCLSRFSSDFPENDYIAWRNIVKARKQYLDELGVLKSEDVKTEKGIEFEEKKQSVVKEKQGEYEKLKDEYIKFLLTEKPSSVRNYSSFKRIEETLSKVYNKEISIYSFCTVEDVEMIITKLNNNPEFIEYNLIGKNQYSNALKWYLKFIQQREGVEIIDFLDNNLEIHQLSSPEETVSDITFDIVKKMVEWDENRNVLDDWKWKVMKDVVDGNKEFTNQMKYAFRLNLLALRKKGFPY